MGKQRPPPPSLQRGPWEFTGLQPHPGGRSPASDTALGIKQNTSYLPSPAAADNDQLLNLWNEFQPPKTLS